MDPELIKRLDEQGVKIEAIYRSVEKTRRYFQWTLIITVVAIVVPLAASVFIIPLFLKTLAPYAGL